jgi:hypothetical protein
MKTYVVFKMADRRGVIEPVLVGVFLNKDRAKAACPPDNRHRRNGTWGLVRSTELDMTGLDGCMPDG